MTETDRLRDLLEQAAPTTPDVAAPDRTAAVVRRGRTARRRDRAASGLVALGVLGRVCTSGGEMTLTRAETELLREEIWDARTDGPTDARECAAVEPTRLRLVDPWGDVVTWTQTSCAGEMSSAEGYWMPSDGARAILDDALSR